MRYLSVFFVAVLAHVVWSSEYIVSPATSVPKALYADWAHKHWIWINAGKQNQTALLQYADDYLAHDIPVGAIDIDSEWSTGINNFVWDTKKFPNARDMIQKFHSKDIKVICWATSMVDTDSPNYQEGFDKKYYLNDGKTIKWWHGHGSFLDYTNPEAVDWWHKQMDGPLSDGLDGWKTDGTDPFVYELVFPYGKAGYITERTYANLYYRDFFYYTRQKRGQDALIMARPVDSMYHIFLNFAPNDVVFSGWVGDQDPTFDGMKAALQNMYHSARRGYVGFGSDIGGYRHGDGKEPLGRSRSLFIRWSQLGAFNSLMENGGNNEHRPWIFDQYYKTGNETTDIYRTFVHAHHELVPYLMSAGAQAYAQNKSIMTPLGEDTIWTPLNWDFLLGNDIFVSPIVDDNTNRTIVFPKGNDWVDYFDSSKIYKGGSKHALTFSLKDYPVYKRAGSIIPLDVLRRYVGHGDESSTGYMTLLIESPRQAERIRVSRFKHEHSFEALYVMDNDNMMLTVSAQPQPIIVYIRGINMNNTKVTNSGEPLKVEALDSEIKIWIQDATRGVALTVHGVQSKF